MWPQQAADKTKMWHNIMTLPGLQIFKNLTELVSERERERKKKEERTKEPHTHMTHVVRPKIQKNQKFPKNLKQV
jgi:hypothetical protein